jgi:antitoxin HigA-1
MLFDTSRDFILATRPRPNTMCGSRIIIEGVRMARSAIHPGEHLAEAIETMGITVAQLARDIKVPANRVTGILHFTRAITADTALRLGRYFGTSPEFWMDLQQIYELRRAEQELGDDIKAIPRAKAKAA